MDKSRSWNRSIVKIISEIFISYWSVLLWFFCLFAIFVITCLMLDISNYYVQLATAILKIEQGGLNLLLIQLGGTTIIIACYLMVSFYFNRAKQKKTERR